MQVVSGDSEALIIKGRYWAPQNGNPQNIVGTNIIAIPLLEEGCRLGAVSE